MPSTARSSANSCLTSQRSDADDRDSRRRAHRRRTRVCAGGDKNVDIGASATWTAEQRRAEEELAQAAVRQLRALRVPSSRVCMASPWVRAAISLSRAT